MIITEQFLKESFKEATLQESSIPKFVWDFVKKHTSSIMVAGILAMVIWGFMKKHKDNVKESVYSKQLERLRIMESVDNTDISQILQKAKGMFNMSQCNKAANFITDRFDNFKKLFFRNVNHPLLKSHIVATNGDLIIDLTAPEYIKYFIQKGQATPWHIKNKNNMKFNRTDYENNMFKFKGERESITNLEGYSIKLYNHKTLGDKTLDLGNDKFNAIQQARGYLKDCKDIEITKNGSKLINKNDLLQKGVTNKDLMRKL